MSAVVVTEVHSRAERDAFIKFPWRIYADDPVWVPPLLLERKEFLDQAKHPFFEHGAAALFLARRDGEIVGRIMASDDPRYNELHDSNAGCFGMYESIDDGDVARALFEAAEGWARSRGRDELMGPIDYSTNYLCALLIDGFQHSPTVLTSHNPPYYAALFEARGYRKVIDFYAWWLENGVGARNRLSRFAARVKGRQSVDIRPVNLKNVAAESERLREIYNASWSDNWGFVPFTEREFEFMAKELRPIVNPDVTLIAEVEGEPVAFSLCVPDINVALRAANGRLTRFGLPIGLAKLLFYKSRLKTCRLVALGVKPEYRGRGIAETLIFQSIEAVMIKLGWSGECSLVLENNTLMNRFLQAIGAEKYKTYRIYSRRLLDERQ